MRALTKQQRGAVYLVIATVLTGVGRLIEPGVFVASGTKWYDLVEVRAAMADNAALEHVSSLLYAFGLLWLIGGLLTLRVHVKDEGVAGTAVRSGALFAGMALFIMALIEGLDHMTLRVVQDGIGAGADTDQVALALLSTKLGITFFVWPIFYAGIAMAAFGMARLLTAALPPEGELRIGGTVGVRYVGHAVSPEYFMIAEGSFSRTTLLAVFTSLETAQQPVGAAPEGAEDDAVFLSIRFVDFDSEIWRPSASQGRLSVAEPGIVLSLTAAEDLGLAVGDSVVVSHTVPTGPGAFAGGTSTLEVLALHPHPLRSIAYIHLGHAGMWGFEDLANDVTGVPALGGTVGDARRALFGADGVALVQGFKDMFATSRDTLEQMSGVILLAELAGLGLALLIAFNTANLNAEERARDHATMFAYGVPLRRVVANLSAEGLLLGLLAMVAGIVFGYALLLWMITEVLRGAFAEVGFIVSVDLARVAISMLAAIVVVTVAPTFTARKLRRMNIPSTLRVME